MEESSSQGGSSRRSRPESSSSNNTRMTPTTGSSANGSAQHLPVRGANGRGVSGASLLQERLRERKVESARASRDTGGERGGVQSSPIKGSVREERRPSSSGVVAAKGMGVKQIEEQVSTLHKQNFDLKLELYHRRQRQEGLEARLEAAEKQIAEQAEMQEVNEQLLAELERRDQALDEAVGVIVTLEDRVDKLMKEREMVRSVDAHFDAPYIHTEDLSSSPPEFKPEQRPGRNLVRMPSFLSERSEGTEALRSLYLPHNHSYSDATLPQLAEEELLDGMNSPRLSVLSESSFLSVYGEKHLVLNAEPEDPRRHRASSSVEKWIDERPAPDATPQRISPNLPRKKQFLSINDVLESPLQRLEKLKRTLEKTTLPEQSNSVKDTKRSREVVRRVFTDKASFEHQQTLPPTPDTISTSTLRHYKNSNDTLAPDQTTFLNTTSAFTPGITYNAYQSIHSMRPRSAGETVTSRREGHGWDTETQEDLTETASIASTSSTYSASYSHHTKRVHTPELFNFGADSHNRDWGRDMMFNEARLPTHKRYNNVRRSSMIEHPRSDDTVVPFSRNNNAINRYGELKRGTTPIDTSPRPELPDRRSSLSATTKLSKSNILNQSPTAATSPAPSNITNNTTRKSRLTSLLFRRADQEPSSPTKQQQDKYPQPPIHAAQRPKNNTVRGNSYFEGTTAGNDEMERATPPPIRRSRTTTVYRPSSAGTGTARERRQSGYGFDGVQDYVDNDGAFAVAGGGVKKVSKGSVDLGQGTQTGGVGGVEEVEEKSGVGRKWFGGLRRG